MGANDYSLRRAQYNYEQQGASHPRFITAVRAVCESDERDDSWKRWQPNERRNDRALRAIVNDAFSDVQRPEHFTDWLHCDECRDHDETWLAQERGHMDIGAVWNPGWDPLGFISPVGFQYFFPDLVSAALVGTEDDFLTDFLVDRVRADGRLCSQFSVSQTRATVRFYEYAMNTRWLELEHEWHSLCCELEKWRQRLLSLRS